MFCAEMAAEVEQRREIELELQGAIEARELTLHYQPLVSCAHGRITGVEALLRWKHPTKGDISPAMIWRNRCSISSWKISRCSMQRSRASCGVMGMVVPEEA